MFEAQVSTLLVCRSLPISCLSWTWTVCRWIVLFNFIQKQTQKYKTNYLFPGGCSTLMQMRPIFHKVKDSRPAGFEAGWPGGGAVSDHCRRFIHLLLILGGWQLVPPLGESCGLPGARRSQESGARGWQGTAGARPASCVIRRISWTRRELSAAGKYPTTNKILKCIWLSVGKYKRFNLIAKSFDSDPRLIEIICCSVKLNPIVLI